MVMREETASGFMKCRNYKLRRISSDSREIPEMGLEP